MVFLSFSYGGLSNVLLLASKQYLGKVNHKDHILQQRQTTLAEQLISTHAHKSIKNWAQYFPSKSDLFTRIFGRWPRNF